MVGAIGFVVDMGMVTVLFLALQIDIRLCAIFGFLVAVIVNYILNKNWTFSETKKSMGFKNLFQFIGVCILGLFFRLVIMEVLLRFPLFLHLYYELLVNMIGILGAAVFNFIGSKCWVFK